MDADHDDMNTEKEINEDFYGNVHRKIESNSHENIGTVIDILLGSLGIEQLTAIFGIKRSKN